jgi:hypothetical protein
MEEAGLVVGNVLFGPADAILRYTGAGDFLDAIVPAGREGIDITCCATFGPDDHLYVSNPFGSSVLRFNGLTGALMDVFVHPGSGGLQIPLTLLFHEGHLYVGDPGAHEIHRYDAMTGSYVDTFVQDHPDNPLRSGFDPQHFAFGADGHLYVAGESSDRVLKYDGVTGTYVGDLVSASDGFPLAERHHGWPRRSTLRRQSRAGRDSTVRRLERWVGDVCRGGQRRAQPARGLRLRA